MISKKLIVLLSSAVAGVSLVGATFAAWAVTDNAGALGIKISPNIIQGESAAYKTMVLEWGDTTQFQNISSLKLGTPQYAYLEVKSTVTIPQGESNSISGGNLSLQLTNIGAYTDETYHLVDNLVVKVYKNRSEEAPYVYSNEITELALGNDTKSASLDIETPVNGSVQKLYFEVAIADGVTTVNYNKMINDIVYLNVNWDRPSDIHNDDLVTVRRVYCKTSYSNPYAYVFKNGSDPMVQNKDFPGEAMTVYDPAEGIYYYDYDTSKGYTHIIFAESDQSAQTADIALDGDKVYYNGSAWVTNVPAITSYDYYLVGDMNSWSPTALKMTKSGDNYVAEFTVPANTTYSYKVFNGVSTYYGYTSTEDGPQTNCSWENNTESAQTVVVTFNPAHSLTGNAYITNALKS